MAKRGRKSAYTERVDATWLNDVLAGKITEDQVKPRVFIVKTKKVVTDKDGKERIVDTQKVVEVFKDGRAAIAYKILTGDTAMISKVLDKLVATKTDLTTGDEPIGGIIYMPEKDTN